MALVLGLGHIRRTAIATRVINSWRRGVSEKWRAQCHNLLEYLFNLYYMPIRIYPTLHTSYVIRDIPYTISKSYTKKKITCVNTNKRTY